MSNRPHWETPTKPGTEAPLGQQHQCQAWSHGGYSEQEAPSLVSEQTLKEDELRLFHACQSGFALLVPLYTSFSYLPRKP